jgi:hypothetical protein
MSFSGRLQIQSSGVRVRVNVRIGISGVSGSGFPVALPDLVLDETVTFSANTANAPNLCDVIPASTGLGRLGGGRVCTPFASQQFCTPSIPSIDLSVGSVFGCPSL